MSEPPSTETPPTPAERPLGELHRQVLGHVNGLKLAAAPERLGAASLSLDLFGPASGAAEDLLGERADVIRLLHGLHHRIWRQGLPGPDRPGVFSPLLTQTVLDGYAIELSRRGLGRALHLPLTFTPEQPRPELPGLRLTLRLVVQPVGGRGSAHVVFLVEPPGRPQGEAPASEPAAASVAGDEPGP